MAERIVSPGVFTRERDLSFLPAGIGEIGAAIVGPTKEGPSFVPTVVTSFADFETKFGSYTTDYYTPYAVQEYFRGNAASVTIVKVGYIGGYKADSMNVISNGHVVATFAPSAQNSSGAGTITGSLAATPIVDGFTMGLTGSGVSVEASLGATSIHSGTGLTLENAVHDDALTPKLGNVTTAGYMYRNFSDQSVVDLIRNFGAAATPVSLESVTSGLNFNSGTETVNSTTYKSTITGNSDAAAARTPFIIAQDSTELFRVYNRIDGIEGNQNIVTISDVTRPLNGNSSPDYAQFTLTVSRVSAGKASPLETFTRLNFDPDSSNYAPKVIGDQFNTVSAAGEVTLNGDYANQSQYIRLGDYDEKTFTGNKSLMTMGYAAPYNPVATTRTVPFVTTSSIQAKDTTPLVYNPDVPYGFKIDETYFHTISCSLNQQYQSAIPSGATTGINTNFLLTNMYGFGSSGGSEGINGHNTPAAAGRAQGDAADQIAKYSGFVLAASKLTTSSPKVQLKFAVPMQHGFDGKSPAITPNTGGDITAANVMGFDCSASSKSGSVAYKKAINTISNPDEIDINMLVTPGIIHSLHPSVTNHAIDKIEARADAFYVMDSAKWDDTVDTAVANVQTLDTNYVATYFPWVKIASPDTGKGEWVPPSVVIPGVIAFTDSVAHEWFAPAGLNRGGLTSVRIAKKKLTHTDRDTLYEGRVNPIATFPGQGVVVFGQKTLQAKPSALDRINVRRLLIRLKKFIASSSRYLVFEQNNSSTRSRFLNIVNPFLESVQSNSGLSAFKVVMDDTNNTPDVIDRNQMVGQIFIQPTRTAEFIILDFSVLPTGAAFPE
jgi:hypothetical protein